MKPAKLYPNQTVIAVKIKKEAVRYFEIRNRSKTIRFRRLMKDEY